MSSYVLDDLTLHGLASSRLTRNIVPVCGTARITETTTSSSQFIDANSNAALLGTTIYQRNNDAEFRKQMADLNDQLKMLKMDVEKKDKLINELSSYREVERVKVCDHHHDNGNYVEKSIIEQTKREMFALSAKHESIQSELTEYKVKVQAREERNAELKREIDTLKSENGTMNSLIVSLRNRIRELESDLGGFENVASKSGITITTLQKDNKELQQHVLELESRIRTHIMEREEAERKTEALNNKFTELTTKVTTVTGVSLTGSQTFNLDTLIQKITDVINENSMIKGKLMTTTESLTTNTSENKANRETIQRLVNELNKCEKDTMNAKIASDNLKAERDVALNTQKMLEKEIETLKERITNIQAAWQASKTELEKKETSFVSQTTNLKQLEYDALFHKNCLNAFKDQISTLLSDGFVKVEANEDQIKEKVRLLMTSSKDRGLMIASMEGKIQQLATQLNDQINLYKDLEAKYRHSEHHQNELEMRLKSLDSEYCANEVLRDNLKSDRVKYLSFLERVGNILKISQISADVGLDMNVDIILARVEQLVKSESDSLQDKQTNIYNLQRKVKSYKEQLDNKELHLDLLRKKLAALEEERAGKCALEREVDDHVTMSKKFKIKVEKLTEQLNGLKAENNELKSQLLDSGCLKSRSVEQDKQIHKLLEKISELESVKEKQAIKITKLRDEMDSVTKEVKTTRTSSDTAVQSLSQELRHLKIDLEKSQAREKSLLDFRSVIAKMLGLDAATLAVADYEIIARIERIITSFNGGILPVQIQPVADQSSYVQHVHHVPSSSTNMSSSISNHHNQKHHHAHHESLTSISTSNNLHHASRSISPSRKHSHYSHAHRDSSSSPHHHNHHHTHIDSSSVSTNTGHNYHNHHHQYDQETSSSSSNGHHHHHHHHNHRQASPSRHRSKSPRKVTIDPNSY